MTFNTDWAQAQADIGDEIATREEANYLLIVGNPVDGFRFRGPFATAGDAGVWAESHDHEADWWVAPLNPPADEEMNLLRSSSILGRWYSGKSPDLGNTHD
jgi:hypothetical protein